MNSELNNHKKVISIVITMTFLVLLVSGISLFFAPSCKVAKEIGWRFFFFDKESWESVHLVFALLFVVLLIMHVILNGKTLIRYFKGGISAMAGISRTAIICAFATVILFLLAAFNIPPAGWLHKAHEFIKFSWGPPCDQADSGTSRMEREKTER
ncbi:MAG: DUF4405 domain-containing protein [Spirochaetes bacterium]|nr:DUF4405 domain-containing protein [Spirochaetota bacterium]